MRLIDLYPACLDSLKTALASRVARRMCMSDATEAIFGTSGRGSPKAIILIEYMARKNEITITRHGRNRYVSLPENGDAQASN